jgi:hypothetical protein
MKSLFLSNYKSGLLILFWEIIAVFFSEMYNNTQK